MSKQLSNVYIPPHLHGQELEDAVIKVLEDSAADGDDLVDLTLSVSQVAELFGVSREEVDEAIEDELTEEDEDFKGTRGDGYNH